MSVVEHAIAIGDASSETLPSGPRVALEHRRVALRDALAPVERERVPAILATLGGMAARNEGDEFVALALARQEVEDLSDVSEWALVEAVAAFRRGDVGDGRWRPTAGELRIEAKRREYRHRVELSKLNRLLDHAMLTQAPKKKITGEHLRELRRLLEETTADAMLRKPP